jgi:hypothetical protein
MSPRAWSFGVSYGFWSTRRSSIQPPWGGLPSIPRPALDFNPGWVWFSLDSPPPPPDAPSRRRSF